MKVIGAGFGRTGTRALKAALERLGYGPCYHMSEVIAKPHRVRQWLEIAEGARADWDAVFAGYQATTDWPGCVLSRREGHPFRARPAAMVRQHERHDLQARPRGTQALAGASSRDPLARGATGTGLCPVPTHVEGDRHGRDLRRPHRARVIQVFERHIAEVKETIPSHRLLVFDVREGWAPLCAFLGRPVPDEPFPRVNDSAQFHRKRPFILLRLIFNGR